MFYHWKTVASKQLIMCLLSKMWHISAPLFSWRHDFFLKDKPRLQQNNRLNFEAKNFSFNLRLAWIRNSTKSNCCWKNGWTEQYRTTVENYCMLGVDLTVLLPSKILYLEWKLLRNNDQRRATRHHLIKKSLYKKCTIS